MLERRPRDSRVMGCKIRCEGATSMEKTITLNLPKDVQDALADAALRYQWTEGEVICAALRYYLLREGPPHFLSLGAGANPDVSAADLEDWLDRDRWLDAAGDADMVTTAP